jgi:crotonobetainyl-CoA:carnitine CoA-transferase CaiB-like acyl-CoA transferase
MTPGTVRTRAPLLGEHTELLLAELGYEGEAIAKLRARRIV